MAFNTDKLSYFHSFSKMPVQSGSNFADGTSLGNAINKSGHTVTSSEVWGSDIPYYGAMGSLDDIKSKVQPYARKNDMCLVTTTGLTYIYDGEGNWSLVNADDATNAGKLKAGQLIKNANDEVVLLYHKGETLTNLTAANNANTNSANNAARLWTTIGKDGNACESRLVEQFVGPTDKAINGLASVSYSPSIANGTLVAGTNYYDYCFSGTILWATARTTATVIDCFEYVGDKLDTSISGLRQSIKDISDVTLKGVVASVTADEQTAQKAGITVDNTISTTPVIKFTSGSVTSSETKLVTGGAVAAVTDALSGRIAQLEGIAHFSVAVVDALPTILVENTIYLVPEEGKTSGNYVEYIAYKPAGSETVTTERIGTTAIDLEGYTTDAEHTALADRVTALDAATTGRVAVVEGKVSTLEGQVETITSTDATTPGSIAKALADAKSYTDTAIETELATGGSIAQKITSAINALGDVAVKSDITITEIKVKSGSTTTTLTPDENKSVTVEIPEVQAATTEVAGVVTISDNNAIAITETSTAAATVAAVAATRSAIAAEMGALTATVSSNKTEVDGKISAIEGQLASTGTTGKAIQAAQETANEALGLAQTSVQSVTRASGSSTLLTVTDGTDATISLSTEVATKSDITTEIDKLSAADGIITTLTTRVGEAEANAAASASAASASEAAAKSAQSAAEAAQSEAAASKTAAEVAQSAAEAAQGEASSSASAAQAAQSAAEGSASSASQSASAASASQSAAEAAQSAAEAAQSAAEAAQAFVEATAEWEAGTDKALGNFTEDTKNGVVTGTTVKTVADEVLALAKSYSDGLHTTSLDYVVLGDSESLPTASAETLGKIYLVASQNAPTADGSAISGAYVEYMTRKVGEGETATYTWEKIGTTAADLSAYAKSADLNVTSTTANGLTYSQTNGVVSVSVAKASTSQVGTVQLTDGYTSTDDTNAATGKSIAAAIATLATTAPVGEGAVKVSQTDGIVSSVTVATETLVSDGAIKASVTDTNALVKAGDALEAIKLAKPENYVASVTGYTTEGAEVTTTQGAAVKVLDGRGTSVTANDIWGTTVTMDANGVVTVDHKYLSSNNKAWNTSITKVEDNKAYVGDTLYGNIQTDMIKDGNQMFSGCSGLTTFDSDLSNLTKGNTMFGSCSSITTFDSDLSSLTDGSYMFQHCHGLTSFSSNLSTLTNGNGMFEYCDKLETFISRLHSLTNGENMFHETKLTTFSLNLGSLTNGNGMFGSCSSLTTFTSDLPCLTDGRAMFINCSQLTSFSSDLSSLTNGKNMFASCYNLVSFNADLSSLKNGHYMFYNCPLTTFSSDLSSLTNGEGMFENCDFIAFSSNLGSLTNGNSMFDTCDKLETFTSDLPSLKKG